VKVQTSERITKISFIIRNTGGYTVFWIPISLTFRENFIDSLYYSRLVKFDELRFCDPYRFRGKGQFLVRRRSFPCDQHLKSSEDCGAFTCRNCSVYEMSQCAKTARKPRPDKLLTNCLLPFRVVRNTVSLLRARTVGCIIWRSALNLKSSAVSLIQ
jgi:hypothetical protein